MLLTISLLYIFPSLRATEEVIDIFVIQSQHSIHLGNASDVHELIQLTRATQMFSHRFLQLVHVGTGLTKEAQLAAISLRMRTCESKRMQQSRKVCSPQDVEDCRTLGRNAFLYTSTVGVRTGSRGTVGVDNLDNLRTGKYGTGYFFIRYDIRYTHGHVLS